MPFNIRQLRLWLMVSGLVVVAIVAGFMAYARIRAREIVRELPEKLGANIQQTANGFTYSQSAGGRTLFTIHASQMVQFKGGGRAELKDVNIIAYGRNSSRFDQIYGSGFEYDPQEKIVRATGEVHIDLQADAEGVQHPDQQPPQELKNPIHVKTSGLEFNEKTGIAQTTERLEFRTPQASGSAEGAVYDSKERTLRLLHYVRMVTNGSPAGLPFAAGQSKRRGKSEQANSPAEVRAESAFLRNEDNTATLEGVTATRGTETLRARTVLIVLRDDSTIDRVTASGNVQGSTSGENAAELKTAKFELFFNGTNELQRAELSGGANYQAQGKQAMHGSAGRVLASFGPRNTLMTVRALENVDLAQDGVAHSKSGFHPSKSKAELAEEPGLSGPPTKVASDKGGASTQVQRVEVKAPQLDLFTREGKTIERATTTGASEIVLSGQENTTPAKPTLRAPGLSRGSTGVGHPGPSTETTVLAQQFRAVFDAQNHLQTLHGEGDASTPVKLVSTMAGQPDRVTTSRTLDAAFVQGADSISSITQSGDFHYSEGARSGAANDARFTAATNTLALSGSPRYSDEQIQLTADSLSLNRGSGEIKAGGNVKTAYLPQSGNSKAADEAMFSAHDPIHVTSQELTAQRTSGVADFTGGARLWQGGNFVQAPTIRFERDQRSLEAQGSGEQRVESVFVQSNDKGKTTPVTVMAARLNYLGAQDRAIFSGGVTVEGADATMKADQMDILLKGTGRQSGGQSSALSVQAAAGPAQLERIIAQGNVTVVQPGRKATGKLLTYVAAEQSFRLTGGPPSIFDAERGQITGNSLTFYTRDDKVVVENPANGSGATRTVIHTRVTK